METTENALRVGRWQKRTSAVLIFLFLVLIVLPSGCAGETRHSFGPEGGSALAEGVALQVAPGALATRTDFTVTKEGKTPIEMAPLLSGAAALSAAYTFRCYPQCEVAAKISLPLSSVPVSGDDLDLYLRGDGGWRWAASASLQGATATAQGITLPGTFAILETSARPAVAGRCSGQATLDNAAPSLLSVLYPAWHGVGRDGSLTDSPRDKLPQGDAAIIPVIQNKVGDAFDGQLIGRAIASEEGRRAHVAAIMAAVKANGYGGVAIDYRELEPALKGAFTQFIAELSDQLHGAQRTLTIYLPAPRKGDSGWDTGAYDWPALGRACDALVLAAERDPAAYHAVMEEVLRLATGQVQRQKLWLSLSTQSRETSVDGLRLLSVREALATLSQFRIEGQPSLSPGKTIGFVAPHLSREAGGSPPRWDDAAKAVCYTYVSTEGPRTVWIENAFSLAYKLALVRRFGLGGVVLDSTNQGEVDEQLWPTLRAFAQQGAVTTSEPTASQLAARWQSTGGTLAPGGSANVTWTVPDSPGRYEVTLLVGDGVVGYASSLPLEVAEATPTPTPTATPRATPTPAPTPTPGPAAMPTPTAVPAATPTPVVPVAAPPSSARYPGIGYGMCVNPGNDAGRAFQMMRAAGFNWAKIQIRWEHIEPSPGQYNWPDAVVNAAQAQGIRLLFSVVTSPSWARPGKAHHGPPNNYQDYADFVGKLAARYRGRVQAYEIWNEQNYYAEWNGQGQMNAAQYVELLRLARTAIKAQDPDAVIVSGGLTPGDVGDLVIDDVAFMEQMYQAGLKNYADVIGVHANVAANNPPDAIPSEPCCSGRKWHRSFFFLRFTQLHDVMARYGDANKQIWFTEFGWASIQNVATSPQPGYEYAAEISEAAHAQYLSRSFQLVKERYPYVGVMMVWNLNYNLGPNDEKSAWSVLRQDWSQRPAYNALATMSK